MKKAVIVVISLIAIFGVLGAVDAVAAAFPPALGGTGTTATPLPGQVLIGTGSGTYTPAYILCAGTCSVSSASGTITITGTGVATNTGNWAGTWQLYHPSDFVPSSTQIVNTVNGSSGTVTITSSTLGVIWPTVNGNKATNYNIVPGTGVTSTVSGATTTISVNLNNGSTQSCSANQFINSVTGSGIVNCGSITFPTPATYTFVAGAGLSISQSTSTTNTTTTYANTGVTSFTGQGCATAANSTGSVALTVTCISGNQSITFTISGDATGTANGTTSITDSITVTGLNGKALPANATGTLQFSGNQWKINLATSSLGVYDANGNLSSFAGSTCSGSQFQNGISAAGTALCATPSGGTSTPSGVSTSTPTYIAVYNASGTVIGYSGFTYASSSNTMTLTGGYPVLAVTNNALSQYAGSALQFLNGLSTNQGGISMYSGINDAGLTQGFFTIDETNGSGVGTGHLMLFTGTSSAEVYPSLLVNGNNVQLTQDPSGYLNFQEVAGGGNGEQSLVQIIAPSAEPQESTLTLNRISPASSTNREFTDIADENYNASTSQLSGGVDHAFSINIAKQGTGTFRPFVLRYWNQDLGTVASTSFTAFSITPNTNGSSTLPTSVTASLNGTLSLPHTNASGTFSYSISNDGNYLEINDTTGTIPGTSPVPYNIVLQNCPPVSTTSTLVTSSSWECALSQAENFPDGSRSFVDWDTEYYPTGSSPNIASGWFDNRRGTSSIEFPFELSWNDGSVNHVGFSMTPATNTSASNFNTLDNNGTGYFTVGTASSTTGAFDVFQNGASTCAGIYDSGASTIYGLTDSLPAPAGCTALGGYYHGLAIGGNSSGTGTPIFGVLNSSQSSNGRGHTALTIYDTNEVDTFNNELDDGNGNARIAGTLNASGTITQAGVPVLTANQTITVTATGDATGTATGTTSITIPLVLKSPITENVSTTAVTSSAITNTGVKSALVLNSGAGAEGAYGGASACSAGNAVTAIGAVGTTTCAAFSTATAANPTASVGTSAVNGSASTYMRSDGAPALSSQFASSSVTMNLYDATTTQPYNFTEWIPNKSITVANVLCNEYAAATTTVDLYQATALATTTKSTDLVASIACGQKGTTTNSITTSTVAAGVPIIASTTATTGVPSWTSFTIYYQTN